MNKRGSIGDDCHYRALNPFEQHLAECGIANAMEDAIEKVLKRFSRRFLQEMRKELKPYRLHNHRVTICAGMGACSLKVNGEHLHNIDTRHHAEPEVLLVLREIEQALDWEWCAYLDGETINPPGSAPGPEGRDAPLT